MSKHELIFGMHSVASILKSQPQRLVRVFVQKERHDARLQQLIDTLQQAKIELVREPRQKLDKLVEGSHQGVVAECLPGREYDESFITELFEQHGKKLLLLVLDGVTDPHNLGACLRTAEAAGVHGVVVPRDNSAGLNSTVRKVAVGAADLVPLIVVTNLARAMREMQELGIWLIGTTGEAAQTLHQVKLQTPMALVMGAEGGGMRRLTRETCDDLVSIPMLGETSSLNVSVATGVCLFEIVRQNSSAR